MLSNKKRIAFLILLAGNCFLTITCGTGWVLAQSVGGTTSGAAAYCTTTNSGVVIVSGYTGNIVNWQSTTDGGLTWNSNVNTTPNQTYFNLNQTTCYRAIVQDGIFPPDTSTIVCITIYPESIGGTISGGGSYCDSTGAGMLTLTGYSGNILYWLFSIDGGNSWAPISNTTATENYINIVQSTLYEAVVQSDSSCPSDTSSPVSFVVSPLTVAGTISGVTTVCAAGNNATLTLAGYTGTITGWELSVDNGVSWAPVADTTDTLSYFNLTQSTLYRVIVQSGICSADTTPVFVINVSPATIAGTISGGGVYCGVPATGIITLSGYTGNIIGWLSSTDNGSSWNSISNTSDTENYSNLSSTTWYSVIIQSGACAADTSAVEIVSVAPQTIAGTIAGSGIACSGNNQDTLTLSGNVGNVTGWLSSTDNGTSWNAIANTTTSQIYTGLTQTTWYEAIIQSGACTIDTALPVVITIVSIPTVNAGSDVSINQGESIVLNGSGTGTPLWTPPAGLSSTALFTPTASPSSTTIYVLTVTDSNNCVNNDSVVITVIQAVFNGKVSNLFTPNGDGLNDNWYVEGIQNYPDNEVFVYNIYGSEVFRKKAYTNDWQGTYKGSELPDGTYYYVIRFESTDMTLRGSVDILRSK